MIALFHYELNKKLNYKERSKALWTIINIIGFYLHANYFNLLLQPSYYYYYCVLPKEQSVCAQNFKGTYDSYVLK